MGSPLSVERALSNFRGDKITSQEILTDPDCAPESVTPVTPSGTGLVHRCVTGGGGIVTLRGQPSAITSLVLLLVLMNHSNPPE